MVLDAWVIMGLQKFEEKVDGYQLPWLSSCVYEFCDIQFQLF